MVKRIFTESISIFLMKIKFYYYIKIWGNPTLYETPTPTTQGNGKVLNFANYLFPKNKTDIATDTDS